VEDEDDDSQEYYHQKSNKTNAPNSSVRIEGAKKKHRFKLDMAKVGEPNMFDPEQ
jgi:hypothetical protein